MPGLSWPNSTEVDIDAIERAEVLSEDQNRDILYNNSTRFLRLITEERTNHRHDR
jgi:predicted TIM-barrel fold metal-dependent hydrolase